MKTRVKKAMLVWGMALIALVVMQGIQPGYNGWFWGYIAVVVGGLAIILLGARNGWLK